MPLTKYLKIFVTRYCCITELKPIFHNPGQWLCKMVIIHALEIHLFNVLNYSVLLTMETVRICHTRKLKGKHKIKCHIN